INITRGGTPYFTKDLQLGGATFIEATQRKFNVGQAEAMAMVQGESNDQDIRPVLEQSCETLALALDRAQAYLRTSGEASAITRIMLCGGSALTPGLVDYLNRRLNVPTDVANPLSRIAY